MIFSNNLKKKYAVQHSCYFVGCGLVPSAGLPGRGDSVDLPVHNSRFCCRRASSTSEVHWRSLLQEGVPPQEVEIEVEAEKKVCAQEAPQKTVPK